MILVDMKVRYRKDISRQSLYNDLSVLLLEIDGLGRADIFSEWNYLHTFWSLYSFFGEGRKLLVASIDDKLGHLSNSFFLFFTFCDGLIVDEGDHLLRFYFFCFYLEVSA